MKAICLALAFQANILRHFLVLHLVHLLKQSPKTILSIAIAMARSLQIALISMQPLTTNYLASKVKESLKELEC